MTNPTTQRHPSGQKTTTTSTASQFVDERKQIMGRLRRAGVGVRHAEFVCDLMLCPDKRDTEADWWKTFKDETQRLGTGMIDVLAGPRGRGKTAMASALLGHVCWLERKCKYTTAMDLLQHIKQGFGQPNTNVKAVYAKTPTLVIDEFHRCDPSDWAHRTIESIIDDRYRNMRDTILITNDRPDEFVKQAGESIASRVKEGGQVIVLKGKDYRDDRMRSTAG